jgi:long-chain acyl-CoA synthetase
MPSSNGLPSNGQTNNKSLKANLDTFPKYLVENSKRFTNRPAMRLKELGIWHSWTWAEMKHEIMRFSYGLKTLDFTQNDKIAIVGSNRPRLYWTFCATQAIGGVPIPVYADAVAEELVYVLEHAEASIAVCQDQEQVDKLLSIADKLPKLKTIIYDETRGMRDYDHAHLHSFSDVQLKGDEILEKIGEQPWLDTIALGKAEDLAVLLYTSGTTGKPKGVMLSHNNLLLSSINANHFDNLNEGESIIAYLPLAWIGDHVFSYGQSYTAGYCVCCPESAETVADNRREIAPSYFFAPPRVFEGMLTDIMVKMEDASAFKQKMFKYFLGVAERFGEKILNKQSVSLSGRFLYTLGNFFIYGPLKNRMGLTRVKVGYTAGEAIGPEIFKFFRSLGINLKQLYGQTEATVFITAQPDGEIHAETVGKASPDVEIKIADDGEVLYRSPGVFIGYYKNDEATRETKDDEGWVKTGDAGFFDDEGHLRIIDRAKDVGKLKDGSLFPPKYVENKLKFFQNIKEAVTFGHERDHVGAFINIDLTAVANWAERNNIAYASYQELAGHPKLYEIIQGHVDEVNQTLSKEDRMGGAQIKRFLILHKELDADDGELTRTQKVRRTFIADRYAPLIEALYDGSKEKFIETEVTFEDGRKGKLSATVEIRDMKLYPVESNKEATE